MSAARKKDSPAMALLDLVWTGTKRGSWRRLNNAMYAALDLAIRSGRVFHERDFHAIFKRYGMEHWESTETSYAVACTTGNLSACESIEAWKDRPPYIVDGCDGMRSRGRVAVGFRFRWAGELVTVTSFAADGTHLTACSYSRSEPDRHGYTTEKLLHRYRITPEDIHLDRKARQAAAKAVTIEA